MRKKIYFQQFSIKNFVGLFLLSVLFSITAYAGGQIPGTNNPFPQDPEAIWEMFKDDLGDDQRNMQGFPPIWNEPINTGTPHGFIIMLEANPRLNDIPLKPGDWIGGFYYDHDSIQRCGGARMWTDTANIMLTLFGNDGLTNPIKDGFYGGEVVELRFFMWETQKEYIVTSATYHVELGWASNGKWYPTSLSKILDIQSHTNMDFFIDLSDNPICINNSVTLSAEEFIGTGGNYTFDWSSDPPGFSHNVQNPPAIALDESTLFSLMVTDGTYTSNHQITVVVHDHPEVDAGEDAEICASETIQLSGDAQNALNTEWSTAGDGTFNNPMILNPLYTPGPQDIIAGSVVLTLTADPLNPCAVTDQDQVTLDIAPLPSVNAGQDMSACGNETVIISATGQHYSSVQWSTSGSGTFTAPNQLTTGYIPTANDITNGVTLTICAEAVSPCVLSTCDQMSISYLPGPTVAAPNLLRICENQNALLNGGVTNNSGVLWTSQGDGTFGNPSSLVTYYTPGVQDIQNNGTTITLTALPIAPCDVSASKDVAIEIQKLPNVVTFGPNTDFSCKTNNYLQLNAVIQEYTTISWSTTGDGFFTSTTNPTTRYYPGTNDKASGEFTLMITANPKQFCLLAITESKTVYIVDNPEVDILTTSNQLVCASPAFPVEAVASAYDEIEWTSDGDGTFNNQNALVTAYTPGTGDLSGGASIKLTLSAAPIAPCQVAALDHIFVNFQNFPLAQAGNNAAICEGQTYQLSGISSNYSSIQWQTNGDGSFNQINVLNPVYSPGTTDIVSGSVNLTLTAQPISPCTVFASDEMTLSIQRLATANAGNDAEICENSTHTLNGQAQHYSSVLWTTSGTGAFSNANILSPVYNPSQNDIAAGSVVLTLTAQAKSPCIVAATDTKTLSIQQLATANAGVNANICQNTTYTLNGQADNYVSLQWSSSGNGIFSNANSLNPQYTPGTTDISSGSAVLTLTAASISPCAVYVSDEMTLGIQRLSTANAGNDAVICENSTHTLNGQAQHYSSVLWTTSGTGAFSNANILSPVYHPSQNDIAAGSLVLTLTAQAQSPCIVAASDTKTLNIQQLATANAGADDNICQNSTYTLSGQAEHYVSVQWTSSGNGNFSNANSLNPQYTPGTTDISSGSAVLTLTAASISPCTLFASDEMMLDIQQLSTANAGSDAVICENSTHTLNGQAQHYSSVFWTTSGTGTFSNANSLNPVYTPGASDIATGAVMLTLTAQSQSPCEVAATDIKVLGIQKLATSNAGTDAEICENNIHGLNGQAENYTSVMWTTSGSGTFSDPGILNPVYTHGESDIINGSVVLTLTAQPLTPCAVAATSNKTLTITPLPTASIGPDETICQDDTYNLNGQAQNYSGFLWLTSGTGTFLNQSTLTPVYIPGNSDIFVGSVTIYLITQPVSPCAVFSYDSKILSIQKLPTAHAGGDATICESDTYALNGFAEQYSAVQWSTSGSGNFSNTNILNPVYTPGATDIANGFATLTLTSQPVSPCAVATSDDMTLFIDVLTVLNDQVVNTEIIKGEMLELSFEVQSQNSGTYTWYFNDEIIESANTSTFVINNIDITDAGYYQSVFSTVCGEVESNEALVEVLQISTQQFVVQQGWSGISSYVSPTEPEMPDVFSNVLNDLIIISDNTGVYWPGQNINTLGDWSVTKGYRIKMANAVALDLSGFIRYPMAELTIPSGWSYLPVNTACEVSIIDQFGALPQIIMIKEIAGTGLYYPEYGVNTLENLQPGKAYEILNISSDPVSIKYPFCAAPLGLFEYKDRITEIMHPWNEIHRTPVSHVFGFNQKALSALNPGDVIGVFTSDNVCAGIMQVSTVNEMNVLTAFATDPLLSGKTGFEHGEPVYFKLFTSAANEVVDLQVGFAPQSVAQNLFSANGISIIDHIEFAVTGMAEQQMTGNNISVDVYPNPTTGSVNVGIVTDLNFKGSVMIMNATGQIILSKDIEQPSGSSVEIFDLTGNPKGVYYLRIVSDQFMKAEKIILK